MKKLTPCRICVLLLVVFARVVAGSSATDPAGYWEGAITLPTSPLAVGAELVRSPGGQWSGNLSVPVQGIRDHPLTNVTLKEVEVGFAMSGIPGDPTFKGKIAADGRTISGDFTQSGQTFPFSLERKAAKPKSTGTPTPAKGLPGRGLAGSWQGSLKPIPTSELRLVLELTNAASGKLGGTLISVDQSNARIPITALTTNGNAVSLEVSSVGGSFDGKMNADGSEIAGEWSQSGASLTVVFKRLRQ